MWLGANDVAKKNTWVWQDSLTPMTYTNWSPGNPSDTNGVEDCLQMWSFNTNTVNSAIDTGIGF